MSDPRLHRERRRVEDGHVVESYCAFDGENWPCPGATPETAATKQVIVMRKDLNMRKGKMIVQGAHASIAFLTNKFRDRIEQYFADDPLFYVTPRFRLSPAEKAWIEASFTKVCVSVDSEAELLQIRDAAAEAGLTVHLIQDSGLTEFGGVPTYTCLAIGPDLSDKIDPITGHLRLL